MENVWKFWRSPFSYETAPSSSPSASKCHQDKLQRSDVAVCCREKTSRLCPSRWVRRPELLVINRHYDNWFINEREAIRKERRILGGLASSSYYPLSILFIYFCYIHRGLSLSPPSSFNFSFYFLSFFLFSFWLFFIFIFPFFYRWRRLAVCTEDGIDDMDDRGIWHEAEEPSIAVSAIPFQTSWFFVVSNLHLFGFRVLQLSSWILMPICLLLCQHGNCQFTQLDRERLSLRRVDDKRRKEREKNRKRDIHVEHPSSRISFSYDHRSLDHDQPTRRTGNLSGPIIDPRDALALRPSSQARALSTTHLARRIEWRKKSQPMY